MLALAVARPQLYSGYGYDNYGVGYPGYGYFGYGNPVGYASYATYGASPYNYGYGYGY